MLRRFGKSVTLAGILAISVSLLATGVASAGDPPSATITPKIEVQKDGWLVISYAGDVNNKVWAAQQLDAYLARALAKMNSSARFEPGTILGSNQMYGSAQSNYGNSYVQATFTTYSSWSSSPASFSGTSSAAWYGTVPSPNCSSILTSHYLSFSGGSVQSVPSGWYNGTSYTNSGQYVVYNTWYEGTSWNGLTASYGGGTNTASQQTTAAFYFSGSGPVVYPSNSMAYGY